MRLSTKIQLVLLDNLVWVLLAVFFLFNALFTPKFFTAANQLNILYQSSTLGLLVLGMAVGLFNGFFVAKLNTNSFLLSMSTQIVMRGLVLFLVPFSIAGLDEGFTFLGRGRIGTLQVAILAMLAVYLVFEFMFRQTVFGRKFALTGFSDIDDLHHFPVIESIDAYLFTDATFTLKLGSAERFNLQK